MQKFVMLKRIFVRAPCERSEPSPGSRIFCRAESSPKGERARNVSSSVVSDKNPKDFVTNVRSVESRIIRKRSRRQRSVVCDSSEREENPRRGFWQVRSRVCKADERARPAKEFDTSGFFAEQKGTSEKIPSCQ